jgi:DNA polymerase III sliding clamp (beta) subunit (PCNA family)
VEFHFKDPNSAGEFRPHNGTAGTVYRYVVMPMRI